VADVGGPVAETTGAKLSRRLRAFLETEVPPQAERAADVLRLHAVALEDQGPAGEITPRG
jgi:hypothetical protein